MFSLTIPDIIAIILGILAMISFIGLKVVRARNKSDPDAEKKQQERIAEYRRKKQEDEEIEHIATSMASDYIDDDEE